MPRKWHTNGTEMILKYTRRSGWHSQECHCRPLSLKSFTNSCLLMTRYCACVKFVCPSGSGSDVSWFSWRRIQGSEQRAVVYFEEISTLTSRRSWISPHGIQYAGPYQSDLGLVQVSLLEGRDGTHSRWPAVQWKDYLRECHSGTWVMNFLCLGERAWVDLTNIQVNIDETRDLRKYSACVAMLG